MKSILIPAVLLGLIASGPALACDKAGGQLSGTGGPTATVQTAAWAQPASFQLADTNLGTGAVGSSTAEDRADRAGTDLDDADAVTAGLAPFWVALATVGTAMLALGLAFFSRRRRTNTGHTNL